MAHPTRKHTKSRQGKRRANWKLRVATTTQCAQCGRKILPHRVCPYCGFYRGKLVIVVKTKEKEGAAAKK